MELSDYDLLGISPKSTFRIVKNAYYELSRIYHPDSSQIIIGMTKKDREIAFQRIQKAYENIKEKMNVVEVDLPETDIEYKVDYIIEKTNKIDIPDNSDPSISNYEEFNEKFNREFENINKFENIDNPYSIHYKVPDEQKRNLQDSQIILKESQSNKSSNIYEFGINYIEDHSTDKYYDFNKLQNIENNIEDNLNYKEIIDDDLNKKLEYLINERNKSLTILDSDIQFIERQKNFQKEIEESKFKVENNRNKQLLK